jgi:hypothetical protein
VLIGLPNVKSLEKAAYYLRANNVPHVEWHEPDFDLGFTSIATAPIRGNEREIFKKYRVYNNASVAQIVGKEHSVLTERSQVRNLPDAPICDTPIAQPTEHSILNRRVAGLNPAGRSNAPA